MIDFDKTLFSIDIAGGMPAPGALLVAEPFLREQYFAHAVICLIDYRPAAEAMGIVMNRTTAYTLQGLLSGINVKTEIPVFCGGPMSCDRLYFMHTLGSEIIPGAKEITQGLFIGGDFDSMTAYINSGYPTEGRLRFFIGYSGWSPHQLDEELRNKVWAVTDIQSPEVLLQGCEDAYWHRAVRQMGRRFKGWQYHPLNPHAN